MLRLYQSARCQPVTSPEHKVKAMVKAQQKNVVFPVTSTYTIRGGRKIILSCHFILS